MQLRRMLERRMESARRLPIGRSARRSESCAAWQSRLLILACAAAGPLRGCSTFSRDGESGMLDVTSMVKPGSIRGPLERKLFGEENPLEMGRRFPTRNAGKSNNAVKRLNAATTTSHQALQKGGKEIQGIIAG